MDQVQSQNKQCSTATCQPTTLLALQNGSDHAMYVNDSLVNNQLYILLHRVAITFIDEFQIGETWL